MECGGYEDHFRATFVGVMGATKNKTNNNRKIVRSVIAWIGGSAHTHKKDQLWDLLTVSSPMLIRLSSLTGGVSDDV